MNNNIFNDIEFHGVDDADPAGHGVPVPDGVFNTTCIIYLAFSTRFCLSSVLNNMMQESSEV
jgi:hypothetical protein